MNKTNATAMNIPAQNTALSASHESFNINDYLEAQLSELKTLLAEGDKLHANHKPTIHAIGQIIIQDEPFPFAANDVNSEYISVHRIIDIKRAANRGAEGATVIYLNVKGQILEGHRHDFGRVIVKIKPMGCESKHLFLREDAMAYAVVYIGYENKKLRAFLEFQEGRIELEEICVLGITSKGLYSENSILTVFNNQHGMCNVFVGGVPDIGAATLTRFINCGIAMIPTIKPASKFNQLSETAAVLVENNFRKIIEQFSKHIECNEPLKNRKDRAEHHLESISWDFLPNGRFDAIIGPDSNYLPGHQDIIHSRDDNILIELYLGELHMDGKRYDMGRTFTVVKPPFLNKSYSLYMKDYTDNFHLSIHAGIIDEKPPQAFITTYWDEDKSHYFEADEFSLLTEIKNDGKDSGTYVFAYFNKTHDILFTQILLSLNDVKLSLNIAAEDAE